MEINFCQHLCQHKEGLSISVDFVAEKSNLEGVRAIPFRDERFCWTVGIGKKLNWKMTEGARKLEQFLLETYTDPEN
ncbi:MAG: hypothetical protein ACI4EG_04620 [Fusicatenibacter sp.]